MKKFIVYFHGYASSPNTDKVTQLKLAYPNDYIHAFLADIDPEIAIKEVGDNIDLALLDHIEEDIDITFIGTSLGAWLAAKMANLYGVKSILINPVLYPAQSLKKYNIPCAKYDPLTILSNSVFFIAQHDEVIDHSELIEILNDKGIKYYIDEEATHRYNGTSFDKVIKEIK